jgi:hypothetical protein
MRSKLNRELNRKHVNVILTRDLSQKFEPWDKTSSSLWVQAEGMGLYTDHVERFQHLDKAFSTYRNHKGGIYMIDYVLTSLPDQSLRAEAVQGKPNGLTSPTTSQYARASTSSRSMGLWQATEQDTMLGPLWYSSLTRQRTKQWQWRTWQSNERR